MSGVAVTLYEALDRLVAVARSEPVDQQNGTAVVREDAERAYADEWDVALGAADKVLASYRASLTEAR